MPTSILLNLGSGDLYSGFPRVTATLWSTEHPLPEQWLGALPPANHLLTLYREWQVIYRSLCDRRAFRTPIVNNELEIDTEWITNISQKSFQEQCQRLQEAMNGWLNSEAFQLLIQSMRSRLDPTKEIRVVIETNDQILRRLPWQQWDFFQQYPNAEMALSQPEYQRRETTYAKRLTQKVRILAILGNCSGIDVKAETRFLRQLQDTEVTFLVSPSERAFRAQLERPSGWDILFFAGHSQTEGETGHLYLNDNLTDNSLTLNQLKEALQAAIGNGLKLAIFNSCDGLGLALALERIHIPVVIVMREAVPNRVAQQFFHQFLTAFAIERLPLYIAVRKARQQLQVLEDEFPGASWLPVICQNPAAESPTWLQLGGMPSCPYRGLFAFQEEDADLFFGREAVTQQLFTAVQNQSLVAIVGASGSGKSSLVLAGLIPQLRKSSLAKNSVVVFRPGNNPFRELAEVLLQQLDLRLSDSIDGSVFRLENDLRHDVNLLSHLINQVTNSNLRNSQKLIVVTDQFEELYTQTSDANCQLFLNQLLKALQSCPALTVVLTLRADFYGYALSYRPFSDVLQGAVYNLGPMDREELKSVIVCPATRMQVKLEPSLTEKLLEAAWESPGRLPLLEFALTQLWSKQSNGWLTHEAYTEIGGVEGALANYAEDVYAQLEERDRDRARHILLQLVQPGVGTESSRRLATRDEVGDANWDLISRLASARLVVTNCSEATGEETVEVVHEALIRNWQRFVQWINLDHDFRHWQESLRTARRRWEDAGQDEAALLRGKLLTDAEYWYHERQNDLGSKERQFIKLSLWQREQTLKRRRCRRTLLIAGFLMALCLAGGAIWGWQASAVNEVKSITASSETLSASDKPLDALIEAIRAKQKLKGLIRADIDTQAGALKALQQAAYRVVEFNRLLPRQESVVWSVAMSSDRQLIAAAMGDSKIHLWSPTGQEIRTLKGHTNRVWEVAFSPDNQLIASASQDKTVRLWSREGRLLHVFQGHRDDVLSVAISPDSQTIASGSNDGTVRLWSRRGRAVQVLKGHKSPVWGIAFSPDGQLLGSTSDDGTVKLWDQTGKKLYSFKAHSSRVAGIAFSPDSQKIATASDDETASLWSRQGKKLGTLVGHSNTVWDVAFSPDGRFIATASWDNTIKLWRPNGDLLTTLNGHTSRVRGVAFSRDGQTLVSGGEDSIVRLWRLNNPLLKILHTKASAGGATFNSDSQWVVSPSDDGTVKFWNRNGRLERTVPQSQPAGAIGITLSPDGQTLVAGSASGRISLWHIDGTPIRTFKGHNATAWHVAFSPDGRMIASASADQTVQLWTLEGRWLRTFRGHRGEVRDVKFSPDGQFLASASLDGTVKLWQLDGTLVRTFPGHEGGVLGLAFSPNGQTISSGGLDRLVKLWRLDGRSLKTLHGHDKEVRGVAFSPDQQMIASASGDGTIKLWDQTGQLLTTLRGHNREVWKVAFSPDSQMIVSSGEDRLLILWTVNRVQSLDPLVFGCNWVRDYLYTNPSLSRSDRTLCNGVPTQ